MMVMQVTDFNVFLFVYIDFLISLHYELKIYFDWICHKSEKNHITDTYDSMMKIGILYQMLVVILIMQN